MRFKCAFQIVPIMRARPFFLNHSTMDSWPKYLEVTPEGELVDVSHKTLRRDAESPPVQQPVSSAFQPPPLAAVSADRKDLRRSTLLWFKDAFDGHREAYQMTDAEGQRASNLQTRISPDECRDKRYTRRTRRSSTSSRYSSVPELPRRKLWRWKGWLAVPIAVFIVIVAVLSLFFGVPNILNAFLRIEVHSLRFDSYTTNAFSANLNATVYASAGGFRTRLEGTTVRLKYGKDMVAVPIPHMEVRRTGVDIEGLDTVQILDKPAIDSLLRRLLFDQKPAKIMLQARSKLHYHSAFSVPVKLNKQLTIQPIVLQVKANMTYRPAIMQLFFDNPTNISLQLGAMSIALGSRNATTSGIVRSAPADIHPGRNEIVLQGQSNGTVDYGIVTAFPSAIFLQRRVSIS
jgi:hypothetical protein